MRRITITIPEGLHIRLRRKASQTGVTISQLIRLRLARSAASKLSVDPLLRVAGICRGPLLSRRIDNEVYYRS
jgi:hypothetical protein